jgi:FkbM family methyltransferase
VEGENKDIQGITTVRDRVPTKSSALGQIDRMGIPVGSVLDVGVQTSTKPLLVHYRNLRHFLFEPVQEFHDQIKKNYKNVDYVLEGVALSDEDGESFLEVSTIREDSAITHSQLRKEPIGKSRNIRTARLDSVMKKYDSEKPYLLKIDVDGVELSILSGAEETLKECSIVILEAHPRNFLDRSGFMLKRDFVLLDVVDICYYDGILRQFDMVFANKKFFDGRFVGSLDYKKWYGYLKE